MNVILLAIPWPEMSQDIRETLYKINLSFLALYFVEIVIKITAELDIFFTNSWNKFEFIVILLDIILSIVGFAIGIKSQ